MEPRCPKRACSGWNNGQKQKQRTKKTEKIMKKMKTTILTSVALAACVSTQLFAQTVVKQDTITISLIGAKQSSVSQSPTLPNSGFWSLGPMYYMTAPIKVTDQDIIKYIGRVLWNNASHYSS